MITERDPLLRRARELAAQRCYDDALAGYGALCDHDPFDPDLWLERAGVAEAAGMREDAVRALFHVVELYGSAGMAEAVEIAQRVLALDPRHRGARHYLSLHAPAWLHEGGGAAAPMATPMATTTASAGAPAPASAGPTATPRFDSVPIAVPLADPLPMPMPVSQSMALPRPVAEPLSGPLPSPSPAAPATTPGARTRRLMHEMISGLRASPLVAELGEGVLASLVDAGRIARFARGQMVFREGDEGASLFVVLQGAVDVERLQPASGTIVRLSTLPAGAFFGELSLIADVPRSATVRVRDPSLLLEVSRETVRALGQEDPRLLILLMRFFRARLVGTLVATSPLFQPFSPEERRVMVRRLRLRELAPSEIVLRQGRVGDGLYVVLIGTLIVFVSDAEGNARKLGVLGPGDVFGEMSLIHDERAMANIGTHTRAWLLRLPRQDFDEIVAEHPEMLERIAHIAAERQARNREILTG